MSWGAEALRCAGHGGGEVAAVELAGATWRGEEGYNAWGSGSRGCEVPREAAGEAGGGLRPPSVAGGGAEVERERGGRKSLDLFAKS